MDACREYEGLISAFIDGEITEPERAKLMEHMAAYYPLGVVKDTGGVAT